MMSSMSLSLAFTAFILNYMGGIIRWCILPQHSICILWQIWVDSNDWCWSLIGTQLPTMSQARFARLASSVPILLPPSCQTSKSGYPSSSIPPRQEGAAADRKKRTHPVKKSNNIIFYKFSRGLDGHWVSSIRLKLSFPRLAHHENPFEVMHVIFFRVDPAAILILTREGKDFIVFRCSIWHPDTRGGEIIRVSPWNPGLRTYQKGSVLMCESVPEKYHWVGWIYLLLSGCHLWGRLFLWNIKSARWWVSVKWCAVFPNPFFHMTY